MSDLAKACDLVDRYPVVHLTALCLGPCASRYRVPVVSLPYRHDDHSQCLSSHLSFAYGNGLDADVVAAVARKMNWTSAVYVGDNNGGKKQTIDRLVLQGSPPKC